MAGPPSRGDRERVSPTFGHRVTIFSRSSAARPALAGALMTDCQLRARWWASTRPRGCACSGVPRMAKPRFLLPLTYSCGQSVAPGGPGCGRNDRLSSTRSEPSGATPLKVSCWDIRLRPGPSSPTTRSGNSFLARDLEPPGVLPARGACDCRPSPGLGERRASAESGHERGEDRPVEDSVLPVPRCQGVGRVRDEPHREPHDQRRPDATSQSHAA